MKAFLLAAGDSTRLRPLTDSIPKPMLKVGDRPILEHNIRLLASHAVRELIVNLHHCPDVVTGFLGNGSRLGVSISYSNEPTLLGTAGALKPFADAFVETFFVLYADNLSTCHLQRLLARHREKQALITIAVFEREDVSASGVVQLAADDRVVRFVEKPKIGTSAGHWVNAGILVLEPEVLNYIPTDRPSDFGRDVIPLLLEREKPVYGYRMSEKLWWIDSPADYARTRAEFSDNPPDLSGALE